MCGQLIIQHAEGHTSGRVWFCFNVKNKVHVIFNFNIKICTRFKVFGSFKRRLLGYQSTNLFKFCFSDSFLLTLEQFENSVSKERNAEKESKNFLFFFSFRFCCEQSSQMFTTNPFLVLLHGAAFCSNNPPTIPVCLF